MTKFFKTIISAALCITLILPTTLKADASNKDTSVIIKDSYSYTDDQNNLIKIDQEIDGTIDVYINSILDHSAKSDLKNDTITVVKYNKQSAKALSK